MVGCIQMMFGGAGSGSFAVVIRNDSAQTLFPFDLALVRGLEIWSKNLVSNIDSLMRALVVVVRKPLSVDVVELVQTYAEKVVQAFALNFSM